MNYLIEANIAIVLFYLAYVLLLRNETDFRRQRIFLVGSLLCALIFPSIEIPPSVNATVISVGIPTIILPELIVPKAAVKEWPAEEIVMLAYFTIAFCIATTLFFHARRVYRTIRQASGKYRGDYYVIESNEDKPSWSFFKTIYIGRANELNDIEKALVMRHEMLHGKLYHSIDILLITLVCIVFWFNPVTWLHRRTLARVHEFEVDELVANQNGADGYCVLLAKTTLSNNGFLLTHHFNQSFILKRINMINSIKKKVSTWKFAVLITVVAIYFAGVSCTEQMDQAANSSLTEDLSAPAEAVSQLKRLKSKYPDGKFELKEVNFYKPTDKLKSMDAVIMMFSFPEKETAWMITETSGRTNEVYVMVDQTAEPIWGMETYYKQLGQALKYPEGSANKRIEGKVLVEFVVNKDGKLSGLKVVKGINDELDTEAIRTIIQVGGWKAGRHSGETIAQKMVLPITFKLDD